MTLKFTHRPPPPARHPHYKAVTKVRRGLWLVQISVWAGTSRINEPNKPLPVQIYQLLLLRSKLNCFHPERSSVCAEELS